MVESIKTAIVATAQCAKQFFMDDSDEEDSTEKLNGFAENVVPLMADHQFQLHFRMSPTTFEYLLHAVYGIRQNPTVNVGQPQINLDKQLMITVWYLGNLESFRSVANRFAISVIEMIDGTAIEINAPKEHRMSYFNRKSYFSVVLQGICDHNMLFADVYAGQPGSKHDYAVFEKSDIFERINNKEVSFPGNSYIIGDFAYKLSNFLMVGFKHNRPLSQLEKNFNIILNKCRVTSY
ncbi:hypothetical protein ILUMI_04114 [Ignelater luminosus]|uniref:DDE Tnp4 domain-containing protein n=1 Tax=Ignelater luminosus TaxID=2038154 RepID=A0A8K0DEH1_IGNLU|nr:hypothetical protein ILUMI_04114 [Ignelater luminosus]